MEKLKNLLQLDIIGWILLAISVLGICDSFACVKIGVLLIVINKLCCALGWNCNLCKKVCKKEE